ncbi:hypothetical protein [Flavobacterium sp.]|uniref:hypothetical protein n=1 Tax=Flavobacterium sp. TaxID=239 RepID=UPI00333F01EC
MDFFKILLKAIVTIVLYSLIFSFLLCIKLDFIELSIKFNTFNMLDFLSWFYLLLIYLLFSFYLVVWLLFIYIYEKYEVYKKINFIVFTAIIMGLYFFVSKFVFERHMLNDKSSINEFIYTFISVAINVYLLYYFDKKKHNKLLK